MRPTIRNIAKDAGVSTATVSMVLRGIEGRTTEETRDRVLLVARKLNYAPVKPPTSQNRPSETRIVTLVPEHAEMENHALHMSTYRGVVSVARQYGYDVLTTVGGEAHHYGEQEKNRYLDRRSDGFIFAVSHHGPWENALKLLPEYGIPAVACFRNEAPPGVAAVGVDNVGAIRAGVDFLIENGHRKIAYLTGPPDNLDEQVRREAWVKVMREHGLEASDRVIVNGALPAHVLNTKEMVKVARIGVTAVVCFNDTEALALKEILKSQGVKVPDDISIIGMDNNPQAAKQHLTTIEHSFTEIGRLAMEAWIELKNGGEAHHSYKKAGFRLIPRATVRDIS